MRGHDWGRTSSSGGLHQEGISLTQLRVQHAGARSGHHQLPSVAARQDHSLDLCG